MSQTYQVEIGDEFCSPKELELLRESALKFIDQRFGEVKITDGHDDTIMPALCCATGPVIGARGRRIYTLTFEAEGEAG